MPKRKKMKDPAWTTARYELKMCGKTGEIQSLQAILRGCMDALVAVPYTHQLREHMDVWMGDAAQFVSEADGYVAVAAETNHGPQTIHDTYKKHRRTFKQIKKRWYPLHKYGVRFANSDNDPKSESDSSDSD